MKRGIIVYNQSFKDKNWNEGVEWYKNAAKKFNIDLQVYTNTEIIFLLSDKIKCLNLKKDFNFVIFLDKDIRLARLLELNNFKVFNSSKAIEICDDKTLTQIVLSENNIPTPKTIISPKFFFEPLDTSLIFLKEVSKILSFPLVLKEGFGSYGEQVYLIKNIKELTEMTKKIWSKPLLFQEFIKESKGRDIRMYVVGGKFVGACLRTNKKDFRANTELGGDMELYIPTKKEIDIAEKSVKSIGLDFAGVDILFGKNGPLICEVNSNSYAKKFYEITKIDVGEKIFEHINNMIYK
ncbi:MAG: RimK family alpha-L-glutamate ligase [Candidatus Nomurabacteria bacterium]